MDHRAEIREFLTTRRARVTPQMVGMNTGPGLRRVKGLRRDEVAVLAGVSVEYYTRLEQGNGRGVSEQVLDGISRALRLDDAEREHLFSLIRAAGLSKPRRARTQRSGVPVRPAVQWILDGMTEVPAIVTNSRLDLVAANRLGFALYSEMYAALPAGSRKPANHGRFVFLDQRAPRFYPAWQEAARETVAVLHAAAGRDPFDKGLTDLVGELSTRSAEFRTLWAAHDVALHRTGIKRFHHPVVGALELCFESLDLAADEGLFVLTYAARPGSPSADGLRLLATWAASEEAATRHAPRDSSRTPAE